jgi:putative YphP/YqiW family bacilliredoxin
MFRCGGIFMSMAYDEYMKQVVKPMRAELTNAGFEELTTEAEVEEFMKDAKVCGCAAGLARPAATQSALNSDKKPNKLVTVFAGQDKEATSKMREYFKGYEPSSPSMALLKDGEVVHFIPRHDIEGNSIENIMQNLENAFEKYC